MTVLGGLERKSRWVFPGRRAAGPQSRGRLDKCWWTPSRRGRAGGCSSSRPSPYPCQHRAARGRDRVRHRPAARSCRSRDHPQIHPSQRRPWRCRPPRPSAPRSGPVSLAPTATRGNRARRPDPKLLIRIRHLRSCPLKPRWTPHRCPPPNRTASSHHANPGRRSTAKAYDQGEPLIQPG